MLGALRAALAAGSRKVAFRVAVKVNGVPGLNDLASSLMSSRTFIEISQRRSEIEEKMGSIATGTALVQFSSIRSHLSLLAYLGFGVCAL